MQGFACSTCPCFQKALHGAVVSPALSIYEICCATNIIASKIATGCINNFTSESHSLPSNLPHFPQTPSKGSRLRKLASWSSSFDKSLFSNCKHCQDQQYSYHQMPRKNFFKKKSGLRNRAGPEAQYICMNYFARNANPSQIKHFKFQQSSLMDNDLLDG